MIILHYTWNFEDIERIFDLSLFVFVLSKSTEKGTEKPRHIGGSFSLGLG